MSLLQLLTKIRDILYQRTKQYYPILDASILLEAFDSIEYEYKDDKLLIYLELNVPPIIEVTLNSNKIGFYQESVKP